jgi:hypothetical protein
VLLGTDHTARTAHTHPTDYLAGCEAIVLHAVGTDASASTTKAGLQREGKGKEKREVKGSKVK